MIINLQIDNTYKSFRAEIGQLNFFLSSSSLQKMTSILLFRYSFLFYEHFMERCQAEKFVTV